VNDEALTHLGILGQKKKSTKQYPILSLKILVASCDGDAASLFHVVSEACKNTRMIRKTGVFEPN
jgi:hypothetical protein